MKQRYLDLAEEFLVTVINHAIIVVYIISVIGCIGQKEPHLGMWICLILLPLYFSFLRKKAKNFLLFFALHLIAPLVVLALPIANVVLKGASLIMAVIYMILSIKNKIKDKDKKTEAATPIFAVVSLSVGMVLQIFRGQPQWANYYMVLVFMYFGCYYIYLFIVQYDKFMLFNKNSTANIPEKEIFSAGLRQTIVYTAGGLGILFLSANLGWFTYLTGILGDGLLAVIRFLIEIFPFSTDDDSRSQLVEENISQGGGDRLEPMEAVVNELLDKILLVISNIFIIGLAILAIYALVKGFRKMWKSFVAGKMRDDLMNAQNEVREELILEKREKEKDKGRRNLFAFLDNKEKIRKLYKKRVTKEKAAILGDLAPEYLQYMTAKECCDKISADELKAAYDKVRYSKEEVSADDVKLAKSGR